jgi:hypothetical protein
MAECAATEIGPGLEPPYRRVDPIDYMKWRICCTQCFAEFW